MPTTETNEVTQKTRHRDVFLSFFFRFSFVGSPNGEGSLLLCRAGIVVVVVAVVLWRDDNSVLEGRATGGRNDQSVLPHHTQTNTDTDTHTHIYVGMYTEELEMTG